MSAKRDEEPLRNVIGSRGEKNQAIKDFLSKFLQRLKPGGPQA